MLHSSNLVIHIYHSVGRYTSVPLSNLQPALSSIGTSSAVPQPAAFPSTWMGRSPLSCASPPSASRSGASNPPGQGLLCLHGIDFFIIAILNIVAQIYDLIKINPSLLPSRAGFLMWLEGAETAGVTWIRARDARTKVAIPFIFSLLCFNASYD